MREAEPKNGAGVVRGWSNLEPAAVLGHDISINSNAARLPVAN